MKGEDYPIFPISLSTMSKFGGNHAFSEKFICSCPDNLHTRLLLYETPSFSISQPLALTKAIAPSVAKIPNYYIPKYNASRPTPVMIKLRSTTVETFAVIVDSLPGATCNIGIANANGVELKNKLRVPVHGECHIFPDKGQYYSARVSTYDKPGSGSFRVLY